MAYSENTENTEFFSYQQSILPYFRQSKKGILYKNKHLTIKTKYAFIKSIKKISNVFRIMSKINKYVVFLQDYKNRYNFRLQKKKIKTYPDVI